MTGENARRPRKAWLAGLDGDWGMAPRTFFLAFGLLSGLYLWLVYPWALNDWTAQQLASMAQSGRSFLDRAYLPLDSAGYLASSHAAWGTLIRDSFAFGSLGLGLFSNRSLYLIGKVALTVWPSHPLVVVGMVNTALFVAAVFHYRAICRHYSASFERFLPLLLANPLVIFVMWTLNKEAVGLFLIAAMLRYSLERRLIPLIVLLIVALYTRNIFFAFGLVLLVWPVLRRTRPWQLLVAASLVWPVVLFATNDAPFGSEFGNLDNLTRYFQQQTRPVLEFAFKVMKFPFGFILGWAIVTTIDTASPALNLRYYRDVAHHLNYAQIALQISSLLFVALLVVVIRRNRWQTLQVEPIYLFFVYTLFTGVFPLSQHRYLLPAYPLLILGALIATRAAVLDTEEQRRIDEQRRLEAYEERRRQRGPKTHLRR